MSRIDYSKFAGGGRIVSAAFVLILIALSNSAFGQTAEKTVTFYNSYGYLQNDLWTIPLKVWVHEQPDFARRLGARAARSQIQEHAELTELTANQIAYFDERARAFIADSESREVVRIKFNNDSDDIIYRIKNNDGRARTDRNGLVSGSIQLTAAKAAILLDAQDSSDGWLEFKAVSKDHGGTGRIRLIPPFGVSVISDVDDTVKVTDIPLGEPEVLRNTFFRVFRAAPCMADQYSALGAKTAFHYVSGGPWQLYGPLEEFLFSATSGFPRGSFHMKDVRTNPFESESYSDVWNLIASGSQQVTFEQKIRQITELMERFPDREFVLIGDSGEKDPEVFAHIRQIFTDREIRIYIRDVVEAASLTPHRLENMKVISSNPESVEDCRIG